MTLPVPFQLRRHRRGIAAYKRGDYVTLETYLNGMDRRPRRTRAKVS